MKTIIERQLMARYPVNFSNNGFGVNSATLIDQPIYGASRIGTINTDTRLYENGTSPYLIPDVVQNTLGETSY
ncbi:MAG: hypothetical protein FGM14_16000, partial [Flavobacteriales bacterium]|nr:hypothetical protein [Flavobacteriales bacterium]